MTEKENLRLKQLKTIEDELHMQGNKYICGIDEVGRGPLAGPVLVAAVIMKQDSFLEYVNDSKKVTIKRRENLLDKIKDDSVAWSIALADNSKIDEINILESTKRCLTDAIKKLEVRPDLVIVDALDNIDTDKIPYVSIIKGDAKAYSIACASILAKVTRDKMMDEYAKIYPQYHFEKNKGYGTKEHIEAIKKYGLTPIHRKTFCKKFI